MNVMTSLLILLAASGQAPSSDRAGGRTRRKPRSRPTAEATKLDAAAKSLEELKQAAARYRITLAADQPKDLVFVADPVLRWTNPLRRTADGATFVWIADGRPEVVGSFYRYIRRGQGGDRRRVSVGGDNQPDGHPLGHAGLGPSAAGIVLAPIPGAPKPAATAVERLRQMHALATEFHAFIDTDEDKTEFRLLSKPLYRYQAKRPDLTDGALFAFVLTTDPEVLLLIESRPKSTAPRSGTSASLACR